MLLQTVPTSGANIGVCAHALVGAYNYKRDIKVKFNNKTFEQKWSELNVI